MASRTKIKTRLLREAAEKKFVTKLLECLVKDCPSDKNLLQKTLIEAHKVAQKNCSIGLSIKISMYCKKMTVRCRCKRLRNECGAGDQNGPYIIPNIERTTCLQHCKTYNKPVDRSSRVFAIPKYQINAIILRFSFDVAR